MDNPIRLVSIVGGLVFLIGLYLYLKVRFQKKRQKEYMRTVNQVACQTQLWNLDNRKGFKAFIEWCREETRKKVVSYEVINQVSIGYEKYDVYTTRVWGKSYVFYVKAVMA
jgi:hypothetical protein